MNQNCDMKMLCRIGITWAVLSLKTCARVRKMRKCWLYRSSLIMTVCPLSVYFQSGKKLSHNFKTSMAYNNIWRFIISSILYFQVCMRILNSYVSLTYFLICSATGVVKETIKETLSIWRKLYFRVLDVRNSNHCVILSWDYIYHPS